ncbi:MAG: hypothetical protein LBF15_01070 [Candidatus Peribacteria bacterium]|jgi:hypothetical protein|nr:hypothetical protein [Candidatus Peribacteria bacterium]
MVYKLKEITDKNIWNDFVFGNEFEFYSFLCSWQWADLQNLADKKVFRYGIYKNPHPSPLPQGEGKN